MEENPQSDHRTITLLQKGFGDHVGFWIEGQDLKSPNTTRDEYYYSSKGYLFHNLSIGKEYNISIVRTYYTDPYYDSYHPFDIPLSHYEWNVIEIQEVK